MTGSVPLCRRNGRAATQRHFPPQRLWAGGLTTPLSVDAIHFSLCNRDAGILRQRRYAWAAAFVQCGRCQRLSGTAGKVKMVRIRRPGQNLRMCICKCHACPLRQDLRVMPAFQGSRQAVRDHVCQSARTSADLSRRHAGCRGAQGSKGLARSGGLCSEEQRWAGTLQVQVRSGGQPANVTSGQGHPFPVW